MRVTQYRIADHIWDATDYIFMMDIICEKQDLNNVLKRLKKRNKYISRHLKISILGNDAKMTYYGTAFMWQDIEDVFPCLSDSHYKRNTTRKIIDPSLISERKSKNPIIFNGRQYFHNKYLGIMEICLN